MVKHTIFVGMGGWDLQPFDGMFYPQKPPRGFRKLEYYSRFFDFVEINSTFYSSQISPIQVRRWLADVASNSEFTFTVKLFRGFTHSHDATPQDVMNIRSMLDAFGSRLGGIVLQFPYSFTNLHERRLYLVRLCKAFESYTRFVELRHNSWDGPLVQKLLLDHGIHPVNVDLPQIKRHMPFTNHASRAVSYFRMMGRNVETWDNPWRISDSGTRAVSDRYQYYYSTAELQSLYTTLQRLQPSPQKTFVVFHNDPNAHSLVNGFQLRRMLHPRQKLSIPDNLMLAFPELKIVGKSIEQEPTLFG